MKPDERLNNVKVYVNGLSQFIQEIAFERGYVNDKGKKEVAHTDAPFLYFKDGKMRYGYNMNEFNESLLHCMSYNEFFETFIKRGLKPFQKVLVRNSDEDIWRCDFFSHKEEDTHAVEVGYTKHDTTTKRYVCVVSDYEQCIPYEGNERLLGTTDKPDEDKPDEDKPDEKRSMINPISAKLKLRMMK